MIQGIGVHLVGLADAAVRESLLRIMTSLQSLGYHIPGRKIVINLAPADAPKKGSVYDLPIATGILAASAQVELPLLPEFILMGELGLDGSVRAVPGVLPTVEMAIRSGRRGCIVPAESAREAVELDGIELYGISNINQALDILSGELDCSSLLAGRDCGNVPHKGLPAIDFSEIIGQEGAKRGLEVAAAGGHNVIMIGPPGSGKSSLANALAGILPPMSVQEAIQTSKIYSVAGKTRGEGLIWNRPFRAPHLSASIPAMVGGGTDVLIPGEISLAHNGVLFLDELGEAPKRLVETLRAPLEERQVTISRLRSKVSYPASFMFVAASNPCPCGYYGVGDRCCCTPSRRAGYISKLSGPLMDRIDIQLRLAPVPPSSIAAKGKGETSAAIAERVSAARRIQQERFAGENISTNAQMNNRMVREYCPLDKESAAALTRLVDKLGFSMRAYFRIIKVARTIADLEGRETIGMEQLMEAASYRFLDREKALEY